MSLDLDIQERVPLASRTTLQLGGPAAFYLQARDDDAVVAGLTWARRRGIEVAVLGGGSNLIIGDGGYDGLVIEMATRGVERVDTSGRTRLKAAAGEAWDELVERAVNDELAGLECLSGIPGRVGAVPIQNVGAYGQEVSDTIVSVRVLDRRTLECSERSPEECDFAYRDSDFKRNPGRFIVLSVTFELVAGGPPVLRYAELARSMAEAPSPSLRAVRERVIALRRRKSMVIDTDDENHRSAGSFFTNPIVSNADAEALVARAIQAGIVSEASEVPRWPAGEGRTKLAAGWLIERAGIAKGTRDGHVGISTRHALALVHHGGGTTNALLAFADRVRARVRERFGVTLVREPVLWGS